MIVRYSRDAVKFLSRLDRKSVSRIHEAINGLTLKPPIGDIKTMQGYHDNRQRLRVGQWRIIFKFGEENAVEILMILEIGNRGDIYK